MIGKARHTRAYIRATALNGAAVINNPMGVLSSMTQMNEAELQKRVQQMKDPKTGAINGLRALEAALATAGATSTSVNAETFTPGGSRSQTSHAIQTPAEAFQHGQIAEGYAPGEDMGRVASVISFLEKMSDSGLKRAQMAGINMDSVSQGYINMVNDAAGKIKAIKDGPRPEDGMSRELQFEQIKQQMNKITQLQDMLSNVLKMMNEQGMTAIRNTRA